MKVVLGWLVEAIVLLWVIVGSVIELFAGPGTAAWLFRPLDRLVNSVMKE